MINKRIYSGMERPSFGNFVLVVASVTLAVVLAIGVGLVAKPRPARAAFPGTNGRIVFMERSLDGYRIKLIRPDGSGLTTLVNRSSNVGYEAKPAMSPRGTRVAYAAAGGNRRSTEIYTINIRTRKVTQITHNKVFDGNPAWSPDGTRVAFERERTVDGAKDTDIYIRRTDGTGKAVNLTKTPDEDESAPAWSPKGEEIAFHTRLPRGTTSYYSIDVFVMNLTTGQRRNLTNDGTVRRDGNPNWSPDGARIVFESFGISGTSIYTMNAADGSDKRLLAEGYRDPNFDDGYDFHGPTYSPNGKKVACVRLVFDAAGTPNGYVTLSKMNASDGSNKEVIRTLSWSEEEPKDLSDPDWGPRKVSR